MRNSFVLIVVFLFILFITPSCFQRADIRSQQAGCTDSDGGSVVNVSGTALSYKAGRETVIKDECVVGNAALIHEAYCGLTGIATSGVSRCSGVCAIVDADSPIIDSTDAAACVPAHCGNKLRDADESGVDCGNACITPCPEGCGNNAVEAGESCDDGNDDDTDACTSSCVAARCGDGYVQRGVEACDDGNNLDSDGCPNSCKIAQCGDGIIQKNEQCDDGNNVELDSCANNCQLPVCGDGVVAGNEQCDDGNTVNGDECSSTCLTALCSDGVLNQDEIGIDCGGSCAACAASAKYSLSVTGPYPIGRVFTLPCVSGLRAHSATSFSCSMTRTLAPGLYHVAVQPPSITEAVASWSVDMVKLVDDADVRIAENECSVTQCDFYATIPAVSTTDTRDVTVVASFKKPASPLPVPSCADSDTSAADARAVFGITKTTEVLVANNIRYSSSSEIADECVTLGGVSKLRESSCTGSAVYECENGCSNGACR
ncbi:MAG TPA: DUF4215 domain-containing protein [Candidatus Nanoarchaeia archaeon]|nr:DUF4215 domain-containing protein [Candidatus Nanoarchaeia archaeon]